MGHGRKTVLRLLALILFVGVCVGAAVAIQKMSTSQGGVSGNSPASSTEGSGNSQEGTGQTAEKASSGNGEDEEDSSGGVAEGVRLTSFEHVVYNDKKEPEAVIKGKQALKQKKTYKIIAPLLLSKVTSSESSGSDLNVQLNEVRLRAERATWLEGEGIVHLYDHVKAEGKDFDISTQDVTYKISDRMLVSNSPITLRKYRTDSSGRKSLAMRITGDGLSVDLTMQKVIIEKAPVARLYDVSEDFLAGDGEKATDKELSDAVVTAEKELTYEHASRDVTFAGSVKAVFGDKELRCEKLVLNVGENQKDGTMDITEITAEEDVRFEYGNEVAQGEKLVWKTVTQNCVLTGENASVRTPEFRMTGSKLSFFRLNSRFQAEGAGELHWVPPRSDEPALSENNDSDSGQESISEVPDFRKDAPVEISWDKAMTYDKAERRALFDGDVAVEQEGTRLNGDTLNITFSPEDGQLQEVTAQGQVRLTQATRKGKRKFSCHRVVWNAEEKTVTLKAAEKDDVKITGMGQQLSAPEITFYAGKDKISCPAAGSMKIKGAVADETTGSSEAIAVNWEKSMDFERSSDAIAVFQGNVKARRGANQISGETLTVNFNEDSKPTRIRVSGNGTIKAVPENKKEDSESKENPPAEGEEAYADRVKALSSGLAGMGGGNSGWQLTCPEFVIELDNNSVRASRGGSIRFSEKSQEDSITWSRRMKVSGKEHFAYFEGTVRAHMSGAFLQSDSLRVEFDANGDLRDTKAEGNVVFSARDQGGWKMECDSCEAFFMGESALRQVVARDNVKVTGENVRVEANQLQLFFKEMGPDEKLTRTRAIARRDVVVHHQGKETLKAMGDLLVWSREDDRYVLAGDPYAEVTRGEVKMRNEKIIMDGDEMQLSAPKGGTPVETEVNTDLGIDL